MKLWMKIAIVVVIVLIGVGVGFKLKLKAMEKKVQADFDQMKKIELSTIKNGEYSGSYGEFTNAATVKVTVEAAKITKVEVTEQKAGPSYEAADIPNRIVAAQDLKVDVVTGASTSSRVTCLAAYEALSK